MKKDFSDSSPFNPKLYLLHCTDSFFHPNYDQLYSINPFLLFLPKSTWCGLENWIEFPPHFSLKLNISQMFLLFFSFHFSRFTSPWFETLI